MLTLIDEATRECLPIRIGRRLSSNDVLDCLADLMIEHGIPEHVRSDNGSEFKAKAVQEWMSSVGVRTRFIERGGPWENGYNERFNGTLRRELLNGEIFVTVPEAEVLVQRWKKEYNQVRPHSSLEYRPPAPEAWNVGQETPRTDRPAPAGVLQACCRGRGVSDPVAQTSRAGQW